VVVGGVQRRDGGPVLDELARAPVRVERLVQRRGGVERHHLVADEARSVAGGGEAGQEQYQPGVLRVVLEVEARGDRAEQDGRSGHRGRQGRGLVQDEGDRRAQGGDLNAVPERRLAADAVALGEERQEVPRQPPHLSVHDERDDDQSAGEQEVRGIAVPVTLRGFQEPPGACHATTATSSADARSGGSSA
jgi:hypothetical protein